MVSNSPLIGIYAAVTRKAETGQEVETEEAISPLQALKLYTSHAAFASGEEKIKGTISKGRLADLVLLDANPCQVSPEEIRNINVRMTILDGEIVYAAF